MLELVKLIEGWTPVPRQTPGKGALLRHDLEADGVLMVQSCQAEITDMLQLDYRGGQEKADVSWEGEHLIPSRTQPQHIREWWWFLETGALTQMPALGTFLQRRMNIQRCWRNQPAQRNGAAWLVAAPML